MGCSAPKLGVEQLQNRDSHVSGRKSGRKQIQAAGRGSGRNTFKFSSDYFCFLSEIRSKQLRMRNRGGMLPV